jgi:hypothetical protein
MRNLPAGGDTSETGSPQVTTSRPDEEVAQADAAPHSEHDEHAAGCACPRTADLDGNGIAASSRRRFLRGAGVLGAGAAAAGLLGSTPAHASGGSGTGGDGDPYGQTTMLRFRAGREDSRLPLLQPRRLQHQPYLPGRRPLLAAPRP